MTSSVPAYTTKEWDGDGSTTVFSFQTKVAESGDLKVWLIEDGVSTLQTLGTHYTLSGVGDAGGVTITFVAAPTASQKVRAARRSAPKQSVNYTDNTRVPGNTTEAQLDRLAMHGQDVDGRLDDLVDDLGGYDSFTGAVAAAAQSASEAAADADRAETAAASVADAVAFSGSFAKALAADGVTDDVAALVTLEGSAEEVIRLKNATYYIGTDYTPTKTLRFSSDTKFLIADGVTVDFADAEPEIHAPKKQRFYFDGTGTGSVVGLDVSWVGWFCGDKLDTDNNALPDLQKWAASVSVGGQLRMTRHRVSSDGSDYIVCDNRPSIVGMNRETSKIRFLGTETRGFSFTVTNGPGGHIQDVGFDRVNPLVQPTVGWAVDWQLRYWTAQRVRGDFLFGGFNTTEGWGKFNCCDFIQTRSTCVHVESCNEVQGNTGIFAANSSWVTLINITGTFQSGESFTFPGGSGHELFTDGSNYMISTTATEVTVGTVITGTVSGATAEITSIAHGHGLGAIRLRERCHASKFAFIEASGGVYPLLIDGSSATDSGRSLSSKFTACHFDSAKTSAAALFYAVGTQFLGCWFSSFDGVNQDVYLEGTDATDFIACQWTSSFRRAIAATATSRRTNIEGGVIADTNTSNTSSIPALDFEAGATGTVTDINIGVNYGYGPNNPKIGVLIGSGCAVTLNNVDVSACPTPIVDNSGGTATILTCPGARTRNRGTATISSGNSSVVVNHGLGFTPTTSDFQISPVVNLAAAGLARVWVSSANATTFTVSADAAATSDAFVGWYVGIKGA